MKKKKGSEIEFLNAEINVLTGLIGNLLHLCSANKIIVPEHIITIIEGLYNIKRNENGNGSAKKINN